jgi:hypothetical protein
MDIPCVAAAAVACFPRVFGALLRCFPGSAGRFGVVGDRSSGAWCGSSISSEETASAAAEDDANRGGW